jgi:hypothetical protein
MDPQHNAVKQTNSDKLVLRIIFRSSHQLPRHRGTVGISASNVAAMFPNSFLYAAREKTRTEAGAPEASGATDAG